jgi:hypothetical protein
LDDNWRRHSDWTKATLHDWRGNWIAGTCANRNIDHPIGMTDLLMMAQLGNDFAGCRSPGDERTLEDKIANYHK